MIGSIAGDVIGSVHEGSGTKTKDFPLFVEDSRITDDTVLTVAVAHHLLHGGDYIDLLHEYFHAYPQAGYGQNFILWAGYRRREPYNSWGNGAAMRVCPIGIACDSLSEVLERRGRVLKSHTITPKESAALRPRLPRFSSRVPGRGKRRSRPISSGSSSTI